MTKDKQVKRFIKSLLRFWFYIFLNICINPWYKFLLMDEKEIEQLIRKNLAKTIEGECLIGIKSLAHDIYIAQQKKIGVEDDG